VSDISISAERQILNLIHRYAECVDDGNFDGVGALFEHGEFHMAGSPGVRGAAVGDLMRRKVATHDGSPRTKHVTTNTIIEFIDAGTASCRSYYTVLQATDSMPLQTVITGRYHDRFERIGDTWHFADRAVFIEQVGDLSQHVRLPRT
jgi:3-phenylpropionate/cinnamic acid dioxygenase small subunit